jgi:hypothetical protein
MFIGTDAVDVLPELSVTTAFIVCGPAVLIVVENVHTDQSLSTGLAGFSGPESMLTITDCIPAGEYAVPLTVTAPDGPTILALALGERMPMVGDDTPSPLTFAGPMWIICAKDGMSFVGSVLCGFKM